MIPSLRMLMCLSLLAASSALADAVGVFTDTDGDVKLLRGQYYYAAEAGVEVQDDDILETGASAAAQIEMRDGTVLKLGNNGRLVLSEYRTDDNRNVIRAGLDVLSGWLRFAVAKLQGGADYHINTPTMTIGIRGTEGVIEAEHAQGALYLEEGEVDVRAPDDATGGATRVRSGDFIQRAYGRPFQRPGAVPPGFHQRMPPVFRQRLQRRAQFLRQQGVPPRQIRRMLQEDRQRYLEQRPHLQRKLQRRFQQRTQEDAEQRKEMQQQRQQERQRRRERRPERQP